MAAHEDGAAFESSFFQSHQRDFNRLQDPDRGVRRAALESFSRELVKAPLSGAHIQALCSSGLLPPFLNLLKDPVEKCRELALGIIAGITAKLPQVDEVIGQIMPAIRARIGGTPVAETSEEVRLQLVNLMADQLLPKCSTPLEASTAEDTGIILCQALHDQYHEIKKAACRAVVAGSKQCPEGMASHAEALMKALLANAAHPHSRVRTAVLQGLDAVVSTGGLPAGSISDVLSQGIKPLAFDKASAVRQLLFASIGHWLGSPSPSRARISFDPHPHILSLLPLLLVGVSDPSPDVASRSLELVEQVGNHLAEPTEETSEKMELDEPRGEATKVSGTSKLVRRSWGGPPLPPPYKGRPGIAIQQVVSKQLSKLLRPLQRELREWTVSLRQGAARVLHTVLVMGGESVEAHMDVILSMLCTAVGDEDADVAQRIVSCGHVTGSLVPPNTWVPIMIDELTAPRASSAQKANRLVILAALLHASEQGAVSLEHVSQIAHVAAGEELRCCDHTAVRSQLLAVLTNLIKTAGPACEPVSQPLLLTLLQLQSSPNDPSLQQSAASAIAALAAANAHSSVPSLYSQHLTPLLEASATDHAHWTAASPNQQLFQTLLRASGESAGPILDQALPLIASSVQQEREPALRISMLQLVDELLESPSLAHFWPRLAPGLLTEVLIPCGIWRAGKVAAAVRHAAMVATGTLLRRDLCTQGHLLDVLNGSSLLAVVRSCLEEDYYVDTRRAACHVMEQIVRIAGRALSAEQRGLLFKDVLKRLDDSNDDIRVEITSAAQLLFASLPENEDVDEVKCFVDGLLIHMDDPEARVQNAVCSALEVAAKARGDLVKEAVLAVQQKHRSQVFSQMVLAAAEGR